MPGRASTILIRTPPIVNVPPRGVVAQFEHQKVDESCRLRG